MSAVNSSSASFLLISSSLEAEPEAATTMLSSGELEALGIITRVSASLTLLGTSIVAFYFLFVRRDRFQNATNRLIYFLCSVDFLTGLARIIK